MLEDLKNKAKEMKKIIENKEDLKKKAKDVWNKSNEIFNETSNIIKEKTGKEYIHGNMCGTHRCCL